MFQQHIYLATDLILKAPNQSCKMKKVHWLVVIGISVLVGVSSCKKRVLPSCDGAIPAFDEDIEPILSASCAVSGCHVAGFAAGDLSTYDEAKAVAETGGITRMIIDNDFMPPQPGSIPLLSNDEVGLISCWMNNGMPEN